MEKGETVECLSTDDDYCMPLTPGFYWNVMTRLAFLAK
jgi:hypothetical protein